MKQPHASIPERAHSLHLATRNLSGELKSINDILLTIRAYGALPEALADLHGLTLQAQQSVTESVTHAAALGRAVAAAFAG